MYQPAPDYDVEGQMWGNKRGARSREPSFEFADRIVRQGFVRKVFGLLAAQLAMTTAVTAAFMYSPSVKTFVATNSWVLITSMIGSFATVIALSVSDACRRRHPLNLAMLFTFTVFESILVGAASATYDTRVVMMAAGITAGVVAGLALFAMQTKTDFTAAGGSLMAVLFTLILASVLQSFLRLPWMHFAISAGGALLFAVYLVFDVQLLMGNGAVSLSPDEYVYATLALYLDVLNLFLYILQILSQLNRNN